MKRYIIKGFNLILIIYGVLTMLIGSITLPLILYSGFTYETLENKYYIDGLIKDNKNNPCNYFKNK